VRQESGRDLTASTVAALASAQALVVLDKLRARTCSQASRRKRDDAPRGEHATPLGLRPPAPPFPNQAIAPPMDYWYEPS
jgi:hypothetical protein